MSNSNHGIISSMIYDKNLDLMLQNMKSDFINGNVRKVGKFKIPIIDVSKPLSNSIIHDYLYIHAVRLFGFKLIEASSNLYSFTTSNIVVNINWQIVNDSFEFSVVYNFHNDFENDSENDDNDDSDNDSDY